MDKEEDAIPQPILPLIPAGSTQINDSVGVCREDQQWIYCIGVQPFAVHAPSDRQSFYLTVAQLIATGTCRPCEIVRCFGVSKRSVLRAVQRYRQSGAAAFFVTPRRGRGGTVLTTPVLAEAQRLLDEGKDKAAVAASLQISCDTLRHALGDGRLVNRPREVALDKSARSVQDAVAAAGMGTACTRIAERVLASLGKFGGAPVRFEACRDVKYGGVLCALPALLANGLLAKSETFLGKVRGYYTAVHVLLLLGFMGLARMQTVQKLGRQAPGEFGRLLGLDRIPEVRCLRRKLDELSAGQCAEAWAAELSHDWMASEPEAVGALYVDGHVRVYHGSLTKLPRKYVTRERLCLRGTTDYWVNDARGRPFFVVERVVDAGLLEALRTDIVPRLLRDVPDQPSEQALRDHPQRCRFTLVFDREGYSPVFFRQMWQDHRIACITYHKHPGASWPVDWFHEKTFTMPDGETVSLSLAEMGSRIGTPPDAMWLREVRKLTASGHQISLIGTAFEADHTVLAARIFSRWCQENFFRYMREHFALDKLAEYGSEPLPDTAKVINPAWRQLTNQKQSVRAKLAYRHARFAELTLQETAQDPKTIQAWLVQKSALLEEVHVHEKTIADLKTKLKQTPKHIQWKDLADEDKFHRLLPGRKRLLDAVRMIAYRAETAMIPLMMNPTVTSADARTILQTLFGTESDILPDPPNERLLIRVHRGACPVTDQHLQQLFDFLNLTETRYPGTSLQMVYELVGSEIRNRPNGDTAISGR
ncbi:MAG: helix-turn-helix domain-containing protein [Magnetococcus sp. WYHC-3]